MKEKVTLIYGIEQGAIAKIKNEKQHEYDEPKIWESLIQLTESIKESIDAFYADDKTWAVVNGQTEIDGKLECYTVPQEIREYLGWEKVDKNGASVEIATPAPVRCALLYTYKTNAGIRRACLYDVTFAKPNLALNTVKDKVNPSTTTINYKAVPVVFDTFDEPVTKIKSNSATPKEVVDAWYQKVTLPIKKDVM